MNNINKEPESDAKKGKCKIKITVDLSSGKKAKMDFGVKEDITGFDIDNTDGWSLEQLQAKYDEFEDMLIKLEDDIPSEEDEKAFEAWEEKCDELGDFMDDLEDKIDEMEDKD